MFKRSAVHYGRTPQPVTPYQKAAQVWDDRIGGARVQARNWRLMAFGSLILSAGFAAALVWQSARGTVVPWVVQVDRLGQAQAIAPAVADYRPTDPQIAFHLARFIEQVRSIPADPIIVRQNWLRAYDFTTDRGAAALNDYARSNDPFTKVGRQQVAVEDAFGFQAVAGHAPPEGRVFMADNPLEGVNRVLKIVGRRGWKTGWHLNGGQWHVAVDQRDAERMKIK